MSENSFIDQELTVDFEVDSTLDVQVGSVYQGASIDDNIISTKKTWSSQKINNELGTKADDSTTTAALALKANSADVYTKTETYTKTEVDNALATLPGAWEGTLAEYNAIPEKDPDTVYYITDANVTVGLRTDNVNIQTADYTVVT